MLYFKFEDSLVKKLNSEEFKNEVNDSEVLALANATNSDYNVAYKAIKRIFKRKENEVIENFDTEFINSTGKRMCKLGIYVFKILHFVKNTKQNAEEEGFVYKANDEDLTVVKFAKKFGKGKYILSTEKHKIAVVDGVIYEMPELRTSTLKLKVLNAYKLTLHDVRPAKVKNADNDVVNE